MTQQSGREPSEMVEAVAKAIAWADDEDYYEDARCYLKRARAAIAAMREATKPMSEAGWNASAKADKEWVSCTPRQFWAAMIDAALSDSRTDKEGER